MSTWPAARLDPVARLRVLAEGVDTAVLVERDMSVPFDRLWSYVADLERSVPEFDETVTRLKVRGRAPRADGGEQLVALATTLHAVALPFDVRLESGFCWMVQRQRLYVVGMAASPLDDTHVRYAHLEGVPRRGAGITRRWLRRHVRHDVEGIARALGTA